MSDDKAHILLIEDNLHNIKFMQMLLEQQGFKVSVCMNAENGIINAKSLLPDLILLDIQLPGMDGLEACNIMRSDPKLSHTPIFALTAFAMQGDRERILEAGFDDYMSKPINYRDFLFTVNRLLSDEE